MIITAKGAKSKTNKAKEDRKKEFLKKFYDNGLADKFNETIETEAKKGHDRAVVKYPNGYYNEAREYFEEELGYTVVLLGQPGVACVSWN